MHESVLMPKPVSSLILLILFVKCLWAPGVTLIPPAKGNPSPSGKEFFTRSGDFYPWANSGPNLCVVLHLSKCTLQTLSHTFSWLWCPARAILLSRKALVGLSAALEPERAHRAAIHCLLSQLSGTCWAGNFIFISLKVCCRWQCPASGDISGDSLENIRKAANSLLGIISVAQIKSRVLILQLISGVLEHP